MAASVAAHGTVLTLIALHAPRLKVPPPVSGPPEAIIPVLIMPRTPPPSAASGGRPQPIRLHRRPQPFVADDLPVAPLVAPETESRAPAPATASGPRTIAGTPPEDALSANARKALRGRLGCSNAVLLNLSRAEREACENQLAQGAKEADFLGTGIEAEKAKGLAAAAFRKDRDRNYRLATPPGTVGAGPAANGQAVGRQGNLPGVTAEGMGTLTGNDKATAKLPF